MNEYKLRPIKFLWQLLNRTISEAKVYILGYRSYTALLTQSGTNPPTAVVLHNELNDVSFIYVSIGSYRIVSTSFVQHKTYIAIQQGSGNQGRVAIDLNLLELGGINDIYINTVNTTFSSVDEILSSTPIEIRVYN